MSKRDPLPPISGEKNESGEEADASPSVIIGGNLNSPMVLYNRPVTFITLTKMSRVLFSTVYASQVRFNPCYISSDIF